MRTRPAFFETARENAARDWETLEAKPLLAGPWWQLFRQVQSPRHVISELMQNAEDAGATWVSARIDGDTFVFEHDGHDFEASEFESLCRFGFSNKRSLLTIGFRGIGFRSTFSVGPKVQVATPSLACYFDKQRFTLPVWDEEGEAVEHTRVSVRIIAPDVRELLGREIDSWAQSPVPLLFFSSIRELRFAGRTVAVDRLGEGPCEGATRVRISGHRAELLVIRSEKASLPFECLEEIRNERGDDEIALPPLAVTVVLGSSASGQLHVVLPTGVVVPGLPVAVHAPFVQDPSRIGIKDPAISPTNRWFLARIGLLLGTTMQAWVSDRRLPLSERAGAYALLPGAGQTGGVAGAAGGLIRDSLTTFLDGASVVLCADGETRMRGEATCLPAPLQRVWTEPDALAVAGATCSFSVAEEAAADFAGRLEAWRLCGNVKLEDVMKRLSEQDGSGVRPPRSVEALVCLWSAFFRKTAHEYWKWNDWWTTARIVPSSLRNSLQPASLTLPALPPRPPRVPEREWEWLSSRVEAVEPRFANWGRHDAASSVVIDACRGAGAPVSEDDVLAFRRAFKQARLDRVPPENALVATIAQSLGVDGTSDASDWVSLARIAWRLGVDLGPKDRGDGFRFACRDGKVRTRTGLVGWSPSCGEWLYPERWLQARVIATEYESGLGPAVESWRAWLASPAGGHLEPVPLPAPVEQVMGSTWALERWLKRAGGTMPAPPLPFKRERFPVHDWRWEDELLRHWEREESAHPDLRNKIAEGLAKAITADPKAVPSEMYAAKVFQESQQHARKPLAAGRPRPEWLVLFAGKECLPDEYGKLALPDQLLRRTPDTESLSGIDRFVHPDYDTDATHSLLDGLGVRSTATGTAGLVVRLVALSGTDIPVGRVRDIYRSLEKVLLRLSAEELTAFRDSIRELPVIRTVQGWSRPGHAFRGNPYQMPGVDVLHADIADLANLWDRVGIAEGPRLEDVIDWLRNLPLDERLAEQPKAAVRAALKRVPLQAWIDAKRWLNASGHLAAVESLTWVAREARILDGLFTHLRKSTADASFLDLEGWELVRPRMPKLLDTSITHHAHADYGRAIHRPSETAWLRCLGSMLGRLKADATAPEAVQRDRDQAGRMAESRWLAVSKVEVVVLVDGIAAGEARDVPVAWVEDRVLATRASSGLFQELVRELSRCFHGDHARSAIRDCAGRSPEWIEGYAREQLELVEENEPTQPDVEADSASHPAAAPNGPRLENLGPGGEAPFEPDGLTPRPESPPLAPGLRENAGHAKHPVGRHDRMAADLRGLGFVWDPSASAFRNGPSLIRARDGLFEWEWEDGLQTCPVWVASRAFDHPDGVEVPVEVWRAGLSQSGLILEPHDGSFRCHRFADLREAIRREEYGQVPSRYRIWLAKSPAESQP